MKLDSKNNLLFRKENMLEMKKRFLFIPTLVAVALLGACGSKVTGVAKVINDNKKLTVAELVEKAKEETGNFTVYSTSSKTDKNVKAFAEKYALKGTFSAVKQSESEFYTAIDKLIAAGSADIDAVVTQNGASLANELLDGSLLNYIPAGVEKSDTYAFMYYLKSFAISKLSTEQFTNVWDLVDTATEVQFKKSNEPINQLFMGELTTDKWSKILGDAYTAKYGEGKLKEALNAGSYKNAGWMFMDKFLKRVVNVSSEGDCAKNCANAKVPFVGFSPVSKYSLGEEGNYNKVNFLDSMNGFRGYAYKFYYQISKTTDRPFTAMLYANYLATADGISSWTSEGNGIYSASDENLSTLLKDCVIENFADVKANWAEIVAKLESYIS